MASLLLQTVQYRQRLLDSDKGICERDPEEISWTHHLLQIPNPISEYAEVVEHLIPEVTKSDFQLPSFFPSHIPEQNCVQILLFSVYNGSSKKGRVRRSVLGLGVSRSSGGWGMEVCAFS